jgi:hypothetical protein
MVEGRTRREFLARAAATGVAATVAGAIPLARDLAVPQAAMAQNAADATLQAFADTMIPGRKAARTDLGHAIHPQAIAGVDPDPGAVEADALLLYHHPLTGFDALEPAFLADITARSAARGRDFVSMTFDQRTALCLEAFSLDNPARVLWEAAAAIPFTAFCAAAVHTDQRRAVASGYRVMGHPGAAPNGYRRFSYGRALARGRTRRGNLP